MDAALRSAVRRRAENRCEYCRLSQAASPLVQFHIEHVLPRQHGGGDELANLCLACQRCNWHKGTNLAGVDQDTGQIVLLFDPRRHQWHEHFVVEELLIVGISATGRATAHLLAMNSVQRIELRGELKLIGLWP